MSFDAPTLEFDLDVELALVLEEVEADLAPDTVRSPSPSVIEASNDLTMAAQAAERAARSIAVDADLASLRQDVFEAVGCLQRIFAHLEGVLGVNLDNSRGRS
jgi:hypothetical protein